MTSYEDKLRSFTQYVRNQLKGAVPQEFLENVSDEDLLDAGRKNPETGEDFFSKEQERHIIMENSSNESIFNAFGNLKHLSHIEEQEKELIEEFLTEVKPVSVGKNVEVTKLLKKFEKHTNNIKVEDIDKTVALILSIFPHWILEGDKHAIVEEEPLSFSMKSESVCMGCLLREILHTYKTFFGWAKHTHTGEIIEDQDSGDDTLETFEIRAKESLMELLTSLFSVKFNDTLDFLKTLEKNKSFGNLFYELCEAVWCHVMITPLISSWVYGKDYAQKAMQQKEEAKELLEGIHDHFVTEFQDCIKTNNYIPFLQNIKVYIHQFDTSQLMLLSHYGFPFDMPKSLHHKIEKIILQELKTKFESK
jgi:hypothetical protein